MAWHGSPTRWVGSSNPGEPDDPWRRWSWPVRDANGDLTYYIDDKGNRQVVYATGDRIGNDAEIDKAEHPDDLGKWGGAEAEFYKMAGGEFIDLVLYQAQADSIDAPNCDPAQEDCWLNRWADGVLRVGGGLNGWRVIPLCLAEGPAYSFIRGRSTPEQARAWAKAGGDYAKELGVTVSYMNGLPKGE